MESEIVNILMNVLSDLPKVLILVIRDYYYPVFIGIFKAVIEGEYKPNQNFYGPLGIVSYKEHIYVCDSCNDQIQIRDENGTFVSIIKGYDNKSGKLECPQSIFVHGSHLYVTDFRNTRVQIFNLPDCRFEYQFSHYGEDGSMTVYNSEIFITSPYEKCINVYTLKGELKRIISNNDNLISPQSIIVSNNLIYVSDYIRDSIVIFSLEGSYKTSWCDSMDANLFHEVNAMLADNEFILICNDMGVSQFNKKGKLIKRWNDSSIVYSEYVRGICRFNNHIIISEYDPDKLVILE